MRTRGRSDYVFHGDRKQYWLRGLGPAATAGLPGLLSAAFDFPLITPGGKGRPGLNTMSISGGGDGLSLLEHLRAVTDHRQARGKRHPLEAILVVIAVAKLCAANSVYAAGQFAAVMPQRALERCGPRRNQRTGRCHPPGLKTIKRAIKSTGAGQADAAICAWLRHETAAGRGSRRHLAIDGKKVNGAGNGAGKAPHLLGACDVTAGNGAAQLDVDDKHNEITCFAGLLACLDIPGTSGGRDDRDGGGGGDDGGGEEDAPFTLITAGALHARTAHVKAMNAAGLDWILMAKGNQAGLEDEICS